MKNNNIKENESRHLENEARSLFSEDVFAGLVEWFEYTLQPQWQYVVFAVRRSYLLALIMEVITGERMEQSSSAFFLTDAAFFLRCQELADVYRWSGKFPPILLCDDIIIHGRNINHIIEGMERELCYILRDEYDEDEIKAALARAIMIHVYTRAAGQLLLLGRYEWNLYYIRKEKSEFWHQLASDIATLISRANMVNASYIFTEYISNKDMEKINLDGYVYTVYQSIQQYTKCKYVFVGNYVKAVASLRIIKNANTDGYRVAPFFFLPNLAETETDIISHEVLERIPNPEIVDWIVGLDEIRGKRTYNEILSLVFSHAILQEFNRENEIQIDESDKARELVKLARNYDQNGLEHTERILEELLGYSLFTVSDLAEMFVKELPAERLVMHLIRDLQRSMTETVKRKIKERIEDYFYQKGYDDEISAYELMQLPYFRTKRRSKRSARPCCFTLAELNQGYTLQESIYCMAYFLQMMDVGVAGISSYAPNDVRVIGYAQFTKAGEQSLLIEPLRWYKYISMLVRMQYECKWLRKPMREEILEYCSSYPQLYSDAVLAAMLEFVEKLQQIGQTPEDWNGNFVDRMEVGENDSIYGDIVDEREFYRRHYKKYAEEKARL